MEAILLHGASSPNFDDDGPPPQDLRSQYRRTAAVDWQGNPMRTRQMALTPDLVAQVHRVLEDPGPDPRWRYHTDEDYDALVPGLLASHPGEPDTWLFAYGSPDLEA